MNDDKVNSVNSKADRKQSLTPKPKQGKSAKSPKRQSGINTPRRRKSGKTKSEKKDSSSSTGKQGLKLPSPRKSSTGKKSKAQVFFPDDEDDDAAVGGQSLEAWADYGEVNDSSNTMIDSMLGAADDPYETDPTSVLNSPQATPKAALSPKPPPKVKSPLPNASPSHQEDTPAKRAFKQSIGRNRKVTLRSSFNKPRDKRSSSDNKNGTLGRKVMRNTRKSAMSINDVVSSVLAEIDDMNKEENNLEDNGEGGEDSDPSQARTRKRTHTDHKLVAGENFSLADVRHRLEENDPDLVSLIIRQTGQNMKNMEITVDDETGESQMNESVTLILPMHLTSSKLNEFASSLTNNDNIRSIDLRGNQVSDESVSVVAQALSKSKKLTHLNLSHNCISSSGSASLVQLINRTLHSLNLSYNAIGDSGAQKLAGGIANTKTLKDLNLAECKIKSYGASFLASAFAVNKSLVSITLSHNAVGGTQASKRIAYALMRNSSLKHLTVCDCGISEGIEHFARFLETTKSLCSLNLSANGISDEGALQLGNALTVNRSLTKLCLKRNKIGDEGIAMLSAALVVNDVVAELDLGGNLIGDQGVAKLSTVLSTNCNLTELDLSDNALGVDSAVELSDVLRSNEVLTVLNVSQNDISAAGLERIKESLCLNLTLEVCYVGIDSLGIDGLVDMESPDNAPFWDTRLIVL